MHGSQRSAHPVAQQLEGLLRGHAVLLQQDALHREQRVRHRQRHRQRQLVCAATYAFVGAQGTPWEDGTYQYERFTACWGSMRNEHKGCFYPLESLRQRR